MMQPQGAENLPDAAPPTLPLDDAGLARARSLSEARQAPPAEVPGYRIGQCLGTGAYGSVWLAHEQNTGKQVRDKKIGATVGVLGRTVHLGDVLKSYKDLFQQEQEEQHVRRVIALIDVTTGKVLDHPWMTPANRERLKDDQVFQKLTLYDEERTSMLKVQSLLRDKQTVQGEHLDTSYADPIRRIDAEAERDYGITWLAAFWPVGDSGWFAVVQEPRDDALRPVRAVQRGLVKYALTGLVLCLVLIATSWHFVRRVMRSRPYRLGKAGKE